MRTQPKTIDQFKFQLEITPRWNDNDIYGHINNAIYYEYFDTLVNTFLMQNHLLELGKSQAIGLVVETACQYFAPLTFPNTIIAGLAVGKIGTSSVRFEIGLFDGHSKTAAAQGHFVHVYVDEQSRRPNAISETMRTVLKNLSGSSQ